MVMVLCHEVAHLAVFRLHGSKAAIHGSEWQHLLSTSGFKARRGLIIGNTSVGNTSVGNTSEVRYIHACPVCQATRTAKRPHHLWYCVACRQAGLEGLLVIHSRPVKKEGRE